MAGSLPFRLRSFFLKAQSDFQPGAEEDASSQLAAQLEGAGLVGSNDSSESEDWEELHRHEHYRFKFRWRSFLSHVGCAGCAAAAGGRQRQPALPQALRPCAQL